jgi:hypothetical protein
LETETELRSDDGADGRGHHLETLDIAKVPFGLRGAKGGWITLVDGFREAAQRVHNGARGPPIV